MTDSTLITAITCSALLLFSGFANAERNDRGHRDQRQPARYERSRDHHHDHRHHDRHNDRRHHRHYSSYHRGHHIERHAHYRPYSGYWSDFHRSPARYQFQHRYYHNHHYYYDHYGFYFPSRGYIYHGHQHGHGCPDWHFEAFAAGAILGAVLSSHY